MTKASYGVLSLICSHDGTLCSVLTQRRTECSSPCRWPPHINLLYPFYEDTGAAFQECAETAAQALSTVQPFQVSVMYAFVSCVGDHADSDTVVDPPCQKGCKMCHKGWEMKVSAECSHRITAIVACYSSLSDHLWG